MSATRDSDTTAARRSGDNWPENDGLLSPRKKPVGYENNENLAERTNLASLKYWSREIAAVLFSLAILVAIFVILSLYNNKEQPNWPSAITLNALVAVLSTLFRSSMTTAVEEGTLSFKTFKPWKANQVL